MNPVEMIELLQFPNAEKQFLFERIEGACIAAMANDAYSAANYDYPIRKYSPADRLAAIVLLLCQKYNDYQALGVPQEIIENNFRDVTLRARIYHNRFQGIGLTDEDAVWPRHFPKEHLRFKFHIDNL